MAALLWFVVALLLVGLLAAWALLYQILRQQGRLLLRLDHLEQLGTEQVLGETRPEGLPVGATLPSFRLPNLTGQPVRLEDYRGRRVLLVHWSPSCGFCELIAPELAKLQHRLRKQNCELVLVGYGEAEANRRLADQHGLTCPVLLQPDGAPLEAFRQLGTPAAYLLDEQGRVAKPLAVGAEQVPALVREAARSRRLPGEKSLRESRIERQGLKAGTGAPAFTLPNVIDGRSVSLADYQGRRVLLVFTDPHCGPCDALAPELARFDQQHRDDGLALVMVGHGEVEENRRKVEQHGIAFPVVVQHKWKLSKQYGIFDTPVAFLIDEGGVIARDVAQGAEQILALARQGSAGKEAGNDRSAV